MLPALTLQDAAHAVLAKSVLPGQRPDEGTVCICSAGLSHLFLCQLTIAYLTSYLHSFLCHFVCHVVSVSPQEQVLGVDAAWVVA
jgi:hypothetical protein